MKWSMEAKQRVEDYLHEVERHLAHKPESVRKDVVEGLRNQISESVQRLEIIGGVIGPEVIEQILAGMDSPESFAEAALEVVGAAATELAPTAIRSGGGAVVRAGAGVSGDQCLRRLEMDADSCATESGAHSGNGGDTARPEAH